MTKIELEEIQAAWDFYLSSEDGISEESKIEQGHKEIKSSLGKFKEIVNKYSVESRDSINELMEMTKTYRQLNNKLKEYKLN